MTSADREPVDRGDHGLRYVTDDLMQRIHFEQTGFRWPVVAGLRALLLIASRAEGLLAGAGKTYHADFRTAPSHFESTDQFVEGAGPKRVVPVWSVDSDPGQAVVDLVRDVGELGHQSPLSVESHTHSFASQVMVLPYYQKGPAQRNPELERRTSHGPKISTHSRELTDRALQVLEFGDESCPTSRDLVCCALGVEQAGVPCHLQRGAEHFP